jgi:hypothetical protein
MLVVPWWRCAGVAPKYPAALVYQDETAFDGVTALAVALVLVERGQAGEQLKARDA